MSYNVIITGASGMVGKGVLLACLASNSIDKIYLINRTNMGFIHPKVIEIVLLDFMQLSTIQNKLKNIDACFFCMGVTSVGLNEKQYMTFTFDIVKNFVDILFTLNPNLVFNYVSGKGTDSTEKGNTMWARVKGKTENIILHKGFKDAYFFRAGIIIPENGIKSKTRLYNFFYILAKPFYPLLKKFKSITTTSTLGKAMINTLVYGYSKKYLENEDINKLANL